jgi:cyclophilin family peptidyl-prolyl cis-trans isomerase
MGNGEPIIFGDKYIKSLMHTSTVSHVVFLLPRHAQYPLLATASVDGVIKFWQREKPQSSASQVAADPVVFKFLRSFRVHSAPLVALRESVGESRYLIASDISCFVSIFDIETIELVQIRKFPSIIESPLIVSGKEEVVYLAARDNPVIFKCDLLMGDLQEIELDFKNIYHINQVNGNLIIFAPQIISVLDPSGEFQTIECAECTNVLSVCFSDIYFSILDDQKNLSIFKHNTKSNGKFTCKLYRKYSLKTKDEPSLMETAYASFNNVLFGEEGELLYVAVPEGIKVINIKDHSSKIIGGGGDASLRFINVSILNAPFQLHVDDARFVSDDALVPQPLLVATAFKSHRFYVFATPDIGTCTDRDIVNEEVVPESNAADQERSSVYKHWEDIKGAVLRTSKGDVEIEFYPKQAPLAVQNFITLMMRGYYNNLAFHRVIRGFMIQTGDPQGDGTGGESCWGHPFADEISSDLKHTHGGTVSMANAGKNSNGSQFFITTGKTQWLDRKHTIFARVIGGMDVVHEIEGVATDRKDRPLQPVSLVQIDPKYK